MQLRNLFYDQYSQLLFKQEDFKESCEFSFKVLESDSDNSAIWFRVAQCAKEMENLVLQRAALNKCFKLKPQLYRTEMEIFLNQIGDVSSLDALGLSRISDCPKLELAKVSGGIYYSPFLFTLKREESLNDILNQLKAFQNSSEIPNPVLKIQFVENNNLNCSQQIKLSQTSQRIKKQTSSQTETDITSQIVDYFSQLTPNELEKTFVMNDSSTPNDLCLIPIAELVNGEVDLICLLEIIFDFVFVKKDWTKTCFTLEGSNLLLDFLLQFPSLRSFNEFICILYIDKYFSELSNGRIEEAQFCKSQFDFFLDGLEESSFGQFFQLIRSYFRDSIDSTISDNFHFPNTLFLQNVSITYLTEIERVSSLKSKLSCLMSNFITQSQFVIDSYVGVTFDDMKMFDEYSYFVFFIDISYAIQIKDLEKIEQLLLSFLTKVCDYFINLNKTNLYFTSLIFNLISQSQLITLSSESFHAIFAKMNGIQNTNMTGDLRVFFVSLLTLIIRDFSYDWADSFLILIHSFLSEQKICHLDGGRLIALLASKCKTDNFNLFCCLFGIPFSSPYDDISLVGKQILQIAESNNSGFVRADNSNDSNSMKTMHPVSVDVENVKTANEIFNFLWLNYSSLVQLHATLPLDNLKEIRKVLNYFQKYLHPPIMKNRLLNRDLSCLRNSLAIDFLNGPISIRFYSHCHTDTFQFLGQISKVCSSKKGTSSLQEYLLFFELNVICTKGKNIKAWNDLELLYHQYALSYSSSPVDVLSKSLKKIKAIFNRSIRCYLCTNSFSSPLTLTRITNLQINYFLSKITNDPRLKELKTFTDKQTIALAMKGNKRNWKFSYFIAKSLSKVSLVESLQFYLQSLFLLKSTCRDSTTPSFDPHYKIYRTIYRLVEKKVFTEEKAFEFLIEANLVSEKSDNLYKTLIDCLIKLRESLDKRKRLEHRSIYLASFIALNSLKDPLRAKQILESCITVKKDRIVFDCWKTPIELYFKHHFYLYKYALLYFECNLVKDFNPYKESISTVELLKKNSDQFFKQTKIVKDCLRIAKGILTADNYSLFSSAFPKGN